MTPLTLSRRRFLKRSAELGGSGLLLAGSAPQFASASSHSTDSMQKPLHIKPQQKALVFIMLDGGNDSYNMLLPYDKVHYDEYRKTRHNLALNREALVPLQSGHLTQAGREFAVHPSCRKLADLFNNQTLSFAANIGPLVEPVNKTNFQDGSATLPLGLLSHADQFKHWQTCRPDQRINQGWFGYMADALQANKPAQQIPMNISLSGSNILQNGIYTQHYSINKNGSVGLIINETPSPLNTVILQSFEALLETDYAADPFKQTYLKQTRDAQLQHQIFQRATEKIPVPSPFSPTELSQQLYKVAQSIKAADRLGLQQQTYFIRYIGWDHHDELLQNHSAMLKVLSDGLSEFQQALEAMDIAENTITFTGSDFGRTLTSNGNGTDHGWGGHSIIMGKGVNGGQIFGQYPQLALGVDNPLDAGDGVIIPTTPIDKLYAELALWFGVEERQINKLFPNLANFPRGGLNVIKI